MDTQLEVLGKGLVELLVVVLVLSNLVEHLDALLDDVLTDDLQGRVGKQICQNGSQEGGAMGWP